MAQDLLITSIKLRTSNSSLYIYAVDHLCFSQISSYHAMCASFEQPQKAKDEKSHHPRDRDGDIHELIDEIPSFQHKKAKELRL